MRGELSLSQGEGGGGRKEMERVPRLLVSHFLSLSLLSILRTNKIIPLVGVGKGATGISRTSRAIHSFAIIVC